MFAQATLDGFFDLLSMPNVFGFWRTLFVNRPMRPDLLIPVIHIEDHPHPDCWYGSVYPIKRGDEAKRSDDMRYAYVPFSDGKEKFEEATYFRAESLAEVKIEHEIPKMNSNGVRRFDTKRLLEPEDMAWLVETLQRQWQERTRKRGLNCKRDLIGVPDMCANHSAQYINRLVDAMFIALGESAFPHSGKAHLYSGPREEVNKQLLGCDLYSNYERALIWAKAHGAFMIDDSRIGQFLIKEFSGAGINDYFLKKHSMNSSIAWAESGKVWRHASRLYVLSLWGDVTTTVCGASDKSVYSKAELQTAVRPEQVALTMPELVRQLLLPRDKKIATINEIPMQKLTEIKNKGGYLLAQRAICLGEQRLALREAIRTSKPDEIHASLSKVPPNILVNPS